MPERKEETNDNEDSSSYNLRVQDGSYKDRARNQIATKLLKNKNRSSL